MAKNSVNKGKHVSYKSKSKKKNASLKISFLVILMLIICGILVYIFRDSIFNTSNISSTFSDISNPEKVITSNTTIQESLKKAVGAEYLEIENLDIRYTDSGAYSVGATIRNISSQSYQNIPLILTLLDKDNNIIATLNCYIDDIEANSNIQVYSIIKKDLSNFSNYSLSLNNN